LTITGGSSPQAPPGRLELTGGMSLTVLQELVLDGFFAVPCDLGAAQAKAVVGGESRPSKRVRNRALVRVPGPVRMIGSVDVDYASSEPLVLGGDFDNRSVGPNCFHWETGGVLLNGFGEQLFEVAGSDRGPHRAAGFESNFAMGSVEIATGATARFVNHFSNQTPELVAVGGDGGFDLSDYAQFLSCFRLSGPGGSLVPPCNAVWDFEGDVDVDLADLACFQRGFAPTVASTQEALYVDQLSLRSGGTMIIDHVTVYYGTLTDNGGVTQIKGNGRLAQLSE
jgi:hypothetical protein